MNLKFGHFFILSCLSFLYGINDEKVIWVYIVLHTLLIHRCIIFIKYTKDG